MNPPTDPTIDRLTLKGISEGMLEQFHLDRGLGYTIKVLILRPGKAVQEYLFENRDRMTRPTTLLLLSVAVATFLSLEYVLPESAVSEAQPGLEEFPEWVQSALTVTLVAIRRYFNLVYMSSLVPMTVATFLVFRSARLNLAEHLVLNSFLFSIQTIMYIIAIPLLVLRESQLTWTALIPAVYAVWFYKNVFDVDWGRGVLKTALVFVLGQAFLGVLAGLALAAFLVAGFLAN